MGKYLILESLLLVSVSCGFQQEPKPENQFTLRKMSNVTTDISTPDSNLDKPIESFSDDSHIGRPHKNKIQIEIVKRADSDTGYKPNNVARINFYSINHNKEWILKQTLEIEDYALAESDPKTTDFNNDGLKDLTFVSNTAARGANEVRTLLIYDKNSDSLIRIKNSEDYPNLAYNETLNCIDSWMVHGASTTVFLRLAGDELKEFASVGTGANSTGECCGLEVGVIDKDGKETVIKRKKIAEDEIYTRYRTFNPPRP
ncbi:MAG: hypothetical protein ABI539_14250 [Acidobacteriota bacterium]